MSGRPVPQVGSLPADLLTADLDTQPGTVAFLRELAAVRQLPVSVPLAFNALAYGFDLATGHYDVSLLDSNRLPTIAVDAVIDALPVGAVARLASGGAPQPCEVVFRHAEHAALAPDGTCPPWLSGAPTGASDPSGRPTEVEPADEVVLHERLVVDATALGAGQPDRLRRLVGRTLTSDGHLLVRAAYVDAEQAELDDTRLYAAYLLRRRSDDLRRVLEPLGLVDGTEMTETVHATFDVVAALLDAAGLVRWRDMYLHPDVYDRWLAGESATCTAEPADIDEFARSTARGCLPMQRRHGGRPARPAYVAIGPALRAVVRDPDDRDRPAPGLRGMNYPTTLACAQMYLADRLTEHGGLLDVGGFEAHVRLDDAWQGGGIWRAHLPQRNEQLVPVDLPLALGWLAATTPPQPYAAVQPTEYNLPGCDTTAATRPDSAVDAVPRIAPETGGEQTEEGQGSPAAPEVDSASDTGAGENSSTDAEREQEQVDGIAPADRWVDDTALGWRFVLGPRHATAGTLPLTAKVAEAMRMAFGDSTSLTLSLTHPGCDISPQQRRQSVSFDGRGLCGVSWPDLIFIGTKLTASWSCDSFQVAVSSTALDQPVDVDGIPLDYQFDAAVVLRHLLGPVDVDAEADALSASVLRALLRRNGRRIDQTAALFVPLRELTAAVRAHAQAAASLPPSTAQVYQAVEALRGSNAAVQVSWGVLLTRFDDPEGPWLAPRWPCEPDPDWRTEPDLALGPGDPAVVLSLHPTLADRESKQPAHDSGLPRSSDEFLRRGHLRRLPRGQTPQQRALAVAYARMMGWDPQTLHPRTTFVHEATVCR